MANWYSPADSDAVITKGLVGLVIQVLSRQTPKDIAEAEIYFIDAIGLTSHLSPTTLQRPAVHAETDQNVRHRLPG